MLSSFEERKAMEDIWMMGRPAEGSNDYTGWNAREKADDTIIQTVRSMIKRNDIAPMLFCCYCHFALTKLTKLQRCAG